MEQGKYYHKVYKLKKDKLTYKEFVSFIQNAVTALIIDEGISPIAKDIVFKYYFAMNYLDVKLPEDEIEAYPLICDIDYGDYQDYIAWNQFIDLKKAFERQCEKTDKYINKDITDSIVEFIQTGTKAINELENNFKDINVKDGMDALSKIMDKLDGMSKEQVLQFVFDKLNNEKNKLEDNVGNE